MVPAEQRAAVTALRDAALAFVDQLNVALEEPTIAQRTAQAVADATAPLTAENARLARELDGARQATNAAQTALANANAKIAKAQEALA